METREYLVQPEYFADRKADYSTAEKIKEVFIPVESEEYYENGGGCGNVAYDLCISRKTKKAKFIPDRRENFGYFNDPTYTRVSKSISSALALYRLICLFDNPVVETPGGEGYKCPWGMAFKHKDTGEYISFGEWKGAFTVFFRHRSSEEVPQKLKDDFLKLFNLLLSDRSPHPYDNVTAGSVA